MASRSEQKELARAQRIAQEKARADTVSARDPVVLLMYELMRRGSVLNSTMTVIVDKIKREEIEPPDESTTLKQARVLAANLPWYGGA